MCQGRQRVGAFVLVCLAIPNCLVAQRAYWSVQGDETHRQG